MYATPHVRRIVATMARMSSISLHSIRVLLVLALVALCACSSAPPRNPLAQWIESPNQDARRPVLIVIHATEQDSVAQSLATLRSRNSGGPVSAHYLIRRDGSLHQLVSDERRAWHAGAGRWGTITDVNSASIGIELDNDGEAAFPDAQIETLLVLLRDLTSRLRIPPWQVIAHADMAPTRKRDPNASFPWKTLAEAGFGIWPDPEAASPPPAFDPWLALAWLGYPLDDRAAAVRAFHRRFRGIEDSDGEFGEEDKRILYSLSAQVRGEAPKVPLPEVPL
jgi:N-acetylmuramoyl-L-alanine amidase